MLGKPNGRRVLYDADRTRGWKLYLLHVPFKSGHFSYPDQRPTETHELQVYSQHG